jgi:hypothetical protein
MPKNCAGHSRFAGVTVRERRNAAADGKYDVGVFSKTYLFCDALGESISKGSRNKMSSGTKIID